MSNALEKIKTGLSPRAREVMSRVHGQLQRVKDEAKRVTEVGVSSVVTVAGGVASGALAAKLPLVPGTQVPSDIAVGAGCVLLAMMGAGGKNNEHLASFGSGMLAVRAAKETEKALK
jgi:sugar (pentulose or hexulose) kinase